MGLENVPRCQHVKVNGVQCSSPALRRKRFCFFHERVQYERKLAAQDKSARDFGFPLLEDANSIQVALMKIVQMLGAGSIDIKTAGLMLYALQTASANLRHARFEPEELTDTIIDEDTVDLTRLGGPQWSSHDFTEHEREKKKDEINVPLPSAEHPAHSMVVNESAADVASRREQKRKIRPSADDDSENSLAKYLLDRLTPGWQEGETAGGAKNGQAKNDSDGAA